MSGYDYCTHCGHVMCDCSTAIDRNAITVTVIGSSEVLCPCPFCGLADRLKVVNIGVKLGDVEFAVQCRHCWIEGPSHHDRGLAISGWNRRPRITEPKP